MEWMHWTWQSALGFAMLGAVLLGMTMWDVRSSSLPRRGVLPFPTTRGDRLFLSIVGFLSIHFAWLALLPALAVAWPLVLGLALTAAVMRWA